MTCPWGRLVMVIVVALSDVIVFFYQYFNESAIVEPISYPAHISGAVIGLVAGITFLKNLCWERFERYIWATSVVTNVLIIGFPIVFSLANSDHFDGATEFLNFSDVCSSGPVII